DDARGERQVGRQAAGVVHLAAGDDDPHRRSSIPSLKLMVSPEISPSVVCPSSRSRKTMPSSTRYEPRRKSTLPSKSSVKVPSAAKCTVQFASSARQEPTSDERGSSDATVGLAVVAVGSVGVAGSSWAHPARPPRRAAATAAASRREDMETPIKTPKLSR